MPGIFVQPFQRLATGKGRQPLGSHESLHGLRIGFRVLPQGPTGPLLGEKFRGVRQLANVVKQQVSVGFGTVRQLKNHAHLIPRCNVIALHLYTDTLFMKKFAWLLIAIFSCCVLACGPDYVYQGVQEIPNNGQWTYADTLNFEFAITDTSARYNFYLDIEHSDTFAFQNLYVNLYTRYPDGHRLAKLRSFDFFDAQGAAVGSCSGERCTLRTVLQENAFFRETGAYIVTVGQNTRRNPLPGVYSVGLALEKLPRKE